MLLRGCAITVSGLAASILSYAFGGFDKLLQTLLLLMAVDMISGIICAVVFATSTKTKTGKLSSRAGLQGFFKKGCCLLLVVVAVHLDALLGTQNLTRDAAIIAFCINELISIMENMGSMGIKMPTSIMNALDVFVSKKEG